MAKQMIIAVMEEDQKCPSRTAFAPQLISSLLKVGAYKRDVLEEPDWVMFFGTLLLAALLIFIFIIMIALISRKDWRQRFVPDIFYQIWNYKLIQRSDP